MENQIFNYNGNNITFQLGNSDVMVNATEMAKPFDKKPIDYLRLPSTNELIRAKVRKSHIDENQLVRTVRGGTNSGTWMHEDIALDFAQWLSVDFKLWCNDRIKELLKHGITATENTLERMLENPDLVIGLATQLKQERQQSAFFREQSELQEKELEKQAPKVEYYDKVLQVESTYNTNLIAKELGMSAITLNKILAREGVQYKQQGTWVLKSYHQNKGYTKTKTVLFKDSLDNEKSQMQTVWTEKGRAFIHSVINKLKQTA